jgi:hypothetical protein
VTGNPEQSKKLNSGFYNSLKPDLRKHFIRKDELNLDIKASEPCSLIPSISPDVKVRQNGVSKINRYNVPLSYKVSKTSPFSSFKGYSKAGKNQKSDINPWTFTKKSTNVFIKPLYANCDSDDKAKSLGTTRPTSFMAARTTNNRSAAGKIRPEKDWSKNFYNTAKIDMFRFRIDQNMT